MGLLGRLRRHIPNRQRRRELLAPLRFGTFGAFVNRPRSAWIVQARPDFDHDHDKFPEFAEYKRLWTHGNEANNGGDMTRLYLFVMNVRRVVEEGIPGDFAELGVYKGNSAAILQRIAAAAGRRVFLFDTFAGFDPREVRDASAGVANAFRDTSLAAVRQFVGTDGVVYVPGFFPESLASAPPMDKFAIVHIDCDLGPPMAAALEHFYPRVSPGGLFLLHDYSSGHWRALHDAVDAFLADKPERLVLMPDKSGTAVLRKS